MKNLYSWTLNLGDGTACYVGSRKGIGDSLGCRSSHNCGLNIAKLCRRWKETGVAHRLLGLRKLESLEVMKQQVLRWRILLLLEISYTNLRAVFWELKASSSSSIKIFWMNMYISCRVWEGNVASDVKVQFAMTEFPSVCDQSDLTIKQWVNDNNMIEFLDSVRFTVSDHQTAWVFVKKTTLGKEVSRTQKTGLSVKPWCLDWRANTMTSLQKELSRMN